MSEAGAGPLLTIPLSTWQRGPIVGWANIGGGPTLGRFPGFGIADDGVATVRLRRGEMGNTDMGDVPRRRMRSVSVAIGVTAVAAA